MTEMMPMISLSGVHGLGADGEQAISFVAQGSSLTAKALADPAIMDALVKGLTTAGLSAQALPLIGQIAGGVALISAFVLKQTIKSRAIKSSYDDAEAQRVELQQQANEIDVMVSKAEQAKAVIIDEVNRAGMSGLGSLTDWLQKTFTPEKYYGTRITAVTNEINALQASNAQKIGYLQELSNQLRDLGNKLTGGNLDLLLGTGATTTQKIILYLGLAAVGGAAAYFISKLFSS